MAATSCIPPACTPYFCPSRTTFGSWSLRRSAQVRAGGRAHVCAHSLAYASAHAATDEQVEKATTVVQSLDLPSFSSRDFENPVLQKHWAAVQALALEEDRVEWGPEQDLLVPDAEGMARFQVRASVARAAVFAARRVRARACVIFHVALCYRMNWRPSRPALGPWPARHQRGSGG